MPKYVALLRGINVGGKSRVDMAELRTCFESLGFKKVSTYINSGNVLFASPSTDVVKLTAAAAKALAQTFDCKPPVALRTHEQLRAVVHKAPKGFGAEPTKYRYDVLFTKEPLTADQALKSVSTKEGVDQVWLGPADVLYFSRLTARATQSHLPRIMMTPVYKQLTIRNWNTTTRLLHLLEDQ